MGLRRVALLEKTEDHGTGRNWEGDGGSKKTVETIEDSKLEKTRRGKAFTGHSILFKH